MKDEIAIRLDKVSKKFKKGQKLLLKEALLDVFKLQKQEEFWALKDISIEIKKGETFGVVGLNGSGKSTLLKLIARVMTPTEGVIKIEGRVSPLIELGAGFHPELTGRENVYLNGSILGLRHTEIDKKFKEIVDFAELWEFIDTPIKHYSSGMYMRLGFAVAVNVNPNILLVDEVLAVGDAPFQEKCISRMREFKKDGITIVFVSHSLETLANFCDRGLILDTGKILAVGPISGIIQQYQQFLESLDPGITSR